MKDLYHILGKTERMIKSIEDALAWAKELQELLLKTKEEA